MTAQQQRRRGGAGGGAGLGGFDAPWSPWRPTWPDDDRDGWPVRCCWYHERCQCGALVGWCALSKWHTDAHSLEWHACPLYRKEAA